MKDFTRTYQITIEAPVHTVFEYCRDPRNLFQGWDALEVTDVTITPEGVGTTAHITGRWGKGLLTEHIVREYVEVVPDERIVTAAHATMHIAGMTKQVPKGPFFTWEFEPIGAHTKLSLLLREEDLPWWEFMSESVSERGLRKVMYRMLENVKAATESRAPVQA